MEFTVTLNNDAVEAKAKFPMFVTLEGIIILVMELQLRNVRAGITFTLDGITISLPNPKA